MDLLSGSSAYWAPYKKKGSFVNYFDSFGNLNLPKKNVSYLKEKSLTIIIDIKTKILLTVDLFVLCFLL